MGADRVHPKLALLSQQNIGESKSIESMNGKPID